jgi:hypothetical protein
LRERSQISNDYLDKGEDVYGVLVEWYWQGKSEVIGTKKKS